MIILGIDPGLATVGFGVIEKNNENFQCLDVGVITTNVGDDFTLRIYQIVSDIEQIIDTYKPSVAAIEELYFNKNVKTAIQVAQVRGAILYSFYCRQLDIKEYNPLQIKITVTGDGAADKKQIQKMVQTIFQLRSVPKPDDAADALAIALTCGYLSAS